MLVLLGIAAIVGVVTGLAKRKSDKITADDLSRSMPLILRQTTLPMRMMDVGAEGPTGLLNEYVEQQDLGGGSFRNTIHLKKIAYREDGVLKRSVHDWVDGDVNFPHVVTRANMLVYTAGDGMRRICPTRDPARWVSIGAPYLKPSTTWTKVNLGTPTRSGNALTWTTAQAKVNVVMGGHLIDLSCEFLGGWQPPNSQIAFPVGMSGLTRTGSVFYADGKPVLTLRPFLLYDAANPMDVRAVDTKLVQVSGQWYALATLPSLTGMARPVLDPTLTLQPGAADGVDTYISGGAYAALNYGIAARCEMVDATSKALYRFNLATIPAGSICTAVTFSLYNVAVDASNRTGTLYQLTAANADFPEGTKNHAAGGANNCCWNYKDQTPGAETGWAGGAGCGVAGVDYINTLLGTVAYIGDSPAGTELPVVFDASGRAAIQGGFGGTFSLMMIIGTLSWYVQTALSDYAAAALRPKLVIEYTEAPAAGGGRGRWLPLMVARR